jgi:hypothetical protein
MLPRFKALGVRLLTGLAWILFVLLLSLILARDTYFVPGMPGRVQAYLRDIEFDFVSWTLDALGFKAQQASLDEQWALSESGRAALVLEYFEARREQDGVEGEIAAHYADPAVTDKTAATTALLARQTALRARLATLQPSAEAVLGEQLSVILSEEGLTLGGKPLPPLSFHFTGLPLALVVSPRDAIRQDANIDVNGEITLEQQVALEDRVARGLDVSTLIVPLGGMGTYPTMVMHSSDLNWIATVVAHEWIHNYLTLRPLGLHYETSPELRTMNETTAELAGNELGALLVARYYPEHRPSPPAFENYLLREQPTPAPDQPPAFDFRAEMYTTRVIVDGLLAQGQVAQAETYMEQRRRLLWEHGYQIRKLNQAYFAFYGAYAASPGGEEGFDAVGPAVRLLRRRSPSLQTFLDAMAGFASFEELRGYLGLAG